MGLDSVVVAARYEEYKRASVVRAVEVAAVEAERKRLHNLRAARNNLCLRVVKTRKEHNCCSCGALVRVGSECFARSVETQVWHSRYENTRRYVTKYYCNACKPVEAASHV